MSVQANLRVAPSVDQAACLKRVERVPGVRKVEAVFPDDDDALLQRMFLVQLEELRTEAAMDQLKKLDGIELIELTGRKTYK